MGLWYPGDNVWHERLILYPVGDGCWIIRTPDGDQYCEQLDCKDADGPSRICLCGQKGRAPTTTAGKFYRFAGKPDDDELRMMIQTAAGQAEVSAGSEKEPAHVIDASGVKIGFSKYFGEKGSKGSLALTNKKDADDDLEPGESHVWLAMESVTGEVIKGQEIELVSGDVRLGDRAIHVMSDGTMLSVRRSAIEDAGDPESEGKDAELSDMRIFTPATYNKAGKRWMNFQSAVDRLSPEELEDWPLTGDRTVEWLCQYICQHGGAPDSRHTRWAAEQNIAHDHMGYILHDLLGYVLELALSYDQLDASNCASLEMVGRIYQLLEETAGTMVVEGLEHYVGRARTGGRRRGVALAPSLAKHVTTNLGTEVDILKQRRKAREEEAAAKEASKSGKKGDKGGGGK